MAGRHRKRVASARASAKPMLEARLGLAKRGPKKDKKEVHAGGREGIGIGFGLANARPTPQQKLVQGFTSLREALQSEAVDRAEKTGDPFFSDQRGGEPPYFASLCFAKQSEDPDVGMIHRGEFPFVEKKGKR